MRTFLRSSRMHILFMVHLKSFNYWYWGFLVFFVVLFYVVNCLTPLFSDDYHYCMMIGADGEEDRWIENIQDVLVSNYYHYFQVNGRFIPHFFIMTFDALLGKQCFNVFNALLFGLYLHLLNLNFVKERKQALMGLAISASLTLGFMCGFTNEFLWMSGVFNYEFVAVLVLLFNYLLNIEIHSKWWMPLLFLYGIMCGWTNEAVVIGLCCVYMYGYIRSWENLKWSQWVLFLGFGVGLALCVFSPGSIHRALGSEPSENYSITSSIWTYVQSLYYMSNLRVFFIMLVICIIVKKMEWKWFIGVVFAILFVAFTGHQSGHSRFGIELFSLIIVMNVFPYEKMPRYGGVIILSATIVYLLVCLPYCVWNYQEFKNVEKQIKQTQNGIISTNEVHPPSYAERLILYWIYPENSDYAFVYNDWYTSMLPRYYGRGKISLFFLPEGFLKDVHENRVGKEFDFNTEYPFYACRWENNDTPSNIKYVLQKSQWTSVPILNKIERFVAKEIPVGQQLLLNIDGVNYLLLKKNPMIQERIIDIKYE